MLLDVTTDDLLLPFNRVSATFELQNGCLIDRLERFVARQEHPYNSNDAIIRSMELSADCSTSSSSGGISSEESSKAVVFAR
jgi:hypothetical protein